MKKHLLLSLLLLSFFTINTHAQGLLGGEIVWEVVPAGQPNTGKFVFYLKVYQACHNDTAAYLPLNSSQIIHSNSPVGDFTLNLLSGYPKDLSPQCNADTNLAHTNCQSPSIISAFNGAYKLYIFTDTIAISGIPSANGYTFYWNGGLRNASNNFAPNQTMRLRSKMFPYYNHNIYPGFDNAPKSQEKPVITTCNGYNFTYYPFTQDNELDSLVFKWGVSLDSSGNNNTMNTGYLFNNPLPNTNQNPNNINAILNSWDGGIQLTTYSSGGYFLNQKIETGKCGQRVGEVYREMYFLFDSCGANVAPKFTPPFNSSTSYIDSVYAGDSVSINLIFTDSQYLSNGNPQTIFVSSKSLHFGNYIAGNPPTMSQTSGCLNPPCATLTAAPIDSLPLMGTDTVSTTFNWQTDCVHLATNQGCGKLSNIYDFYFKYWDDHCPIPAYNYGKFTIAVFPKPAPLAPIIDSLIVDTVTGAATLYWQQSVDIFNSFYKYYIYYSKFSNGPFSEIDSLTNISDSVYIHQNAHADSLKCYYYVGVRSLSIQHSLNSYSNTVHNNYKDIEILKIYDLMDNPNKDVIVKLRNNGIETIDSARLSYMQQDSTIIIENVALGLSAGNTMDYWFNQNFIIGANTNFQLCVDAHIKNDFRKNNNFKCKLLPLSVKEKDKSAFLFYDISPNPATSSIEINYFSPQKTQIDLEIYDISGRIVLHKMLLLQEGSNSINVDLNNLKTGIYFYNIRSKQIVKVGKIIIEQ